MLKESAEGDNLTPPLIDTITDYLIYRIKGRGNKSQRAISISLLHTKLFDIETIVNLKIIADMIHIEGIKARLRLTQCSFHLARL